MAHLCEPGLHFYKRYPTTFTSPSWNQGSQPQMQHSAELLPPGRRASHGMQNDWAQVGRYHTWGKGLSGKVKIQNLIHKTWWGRAFTFYPPPSPNVPLLRNHDLGGKVSSNHLDRLRPGKASMWGLAVPGSDLGSRPASGPAGRICQGSTISYGGPGQVAHYSLSSVIFDDSANPSVSHTQSGANCLPVEGRTVWISQG